MATYTCPNGHQSTTSDYCDTCGEPIGSLSGSPAPAPVPVPTPAPAVSSIAPVVCPNCQASNPGDALFCEVCGYDFTTGQAPPEEPPPVMPAPVVAPTMSGWTVELTADAAWYESQKNQDSDPFPADAAPRTIELPEHVALVGRVSTSRNIHPEIDAGGDTAVSRRHAQFIQDASGWSIVDLQSTNGTHVAKAGQPVQDNPLQGGVPMPLADGDSVYVGVWTKMTLHSPLGSAPAAPPALGNASTPVDPGASPV